MTSANLYHACENNNIEQVMRYIESANINDIINEKCHPSGSTALHIAAHKGHNEIVKLLLKNGAFRSTTNKYGLTPFEEARTEETKDLFRRINTRHSFIGNLDDADYIEWVIADADLVKECDHFKNGTDSLKRYDYLATRELLVEIISYYIKEYLVHSENLPDARIKEIEYHFTEALHQRDIRYLIKAYTSSATKFHEILNKHLAKYLMDYFDQKINFRPNYRLVNCLKNIVALLIHHPDFINHHFIGTTYRGMLMTENDFGKYQTGSQIMNRTFLSTSKKLTVAEFFAGEGQQNSFRKTPDRTPIQISVVCQYKIRNIRTALDIEFMSNILDEQEVLITPFATFNVTNVKRHDPITNPSVLVEIELEEYESVCEPTHLCELIRYQHKRYSRIERLMNPAKSFSIEQSYINLAILEIEEQQKKEKKLCDAQQRDAIIGTFEEIHEAEALVDVKDIFETCKSQTKKVLVLGRAGIGKTTFCQYVAYRWANGTLWPQYKLIFLIPLRRLTESRYPPLPSGISYSPVDLVEKECFHHALSDKDKIYLIEQFDKSQVLWLLDGYDEIVQNVPAHLEYLFEQLLNTPHHILTSRPYSNKLSYDVVMDIIGFTDDNIAEYVKQFFDQITGKSDDASSTGQNLLDFLKLSTNIWGIAHIPVNLELICSLWADTDWSISRELTVTQLYDRITEWLCRRYLEKQRNIETILMTKEDVYKSCHKELAFLESMAFNAMKTNTIILRPPLLKKALKDTECSLTDHPYLLNIGILKSFNHQAVGTHIETDKDHYFVHLSFQEHFAARYLVAALADPPCQEVIEFLKCYKYNQRFGQVFIFVSGLLTESNSESCITTFWATILRAPLDLVGLRHIQLVIACAEETSGNPNLPGRAELISLIIKWLKYAVLAESDVILEQLTDSFRRSASLTREPALIDTLIQLLQNQQPNVKTNVCSLISKLPLTKTHSKLIHSLLIALRDDSANVRYSACQTLGKIGDKAATSKVIRALLNALDDEEEHVRSSACEALGNMGDKAGTAEVIRALLAALGDEKEHVRRNACEALGKLGDEAATSEVIRALLSALGHENAIVRSSACEALGNMGDKAGTAEVITALLNALDDEEEYVGSSACEALGKLGDKAGTAEVIRALLSALGDKNENVRYSTCKALGKLGDEAATSEVIRALLNALGDKNENVRYSTCKALGKLGDEAATSEVIRALLNALGDKDKGVRYFACEALGKMGGKAATSEVIRALLNALGDEEEYVRRNACEALGNMGDKAGTAEVIRALLIALGHEKTK
ncbi:unnamed protein product [Didymodactylos carnosus]|uniref:NACHT domain-containing protein n=1 Tax=Didymodactylos carnosus TaxID=1234261 RepID=A0A8S2IMC1_9BILA|nr:unnamed protein product [Didymodactylos carnosus]CAF3743207.1 unnamed protein product [Didymodactylos carnosus]